MVKGKGWKLILGSSNSFDSVLGPPFRVRMQGPHSVHSANFRRQKLDKQENAPEIDPRPLAIGEERTLGNILFQLNENTTLEYNTNRKTIN